MPKADACDIVSRVVRYEILSIGNSITDYDAGRNHCSEGEYFVDAAIAVLDIGFSMLKRTKRLAKPNHPFVECSCVCVDSSPAYSCCASVKYCPVVMSYYLIYGTLRKVKPYLAEIQRHGEGDERDDDEDYWAQRKLPLEPESSEELIRTWVKAVGYATSDGSPHPLRSVMLKYVKLPPMLPYHGPNDQPINIRDPWLYDALMSVDQIIRDKRMPEVKHDSVPEIGGISIGDEDGATGS